METQTTETTTPARTRRPSVNAETFVAAWKEASQTGKTLQELADSLGVGYNNLLARAKTYRDAGVKLPEITRKAGGSKINVDKLNALLNG